MVEPHDGLTFGGMELLAKLSSGGMGDVLLARRRGAHGFEKLIAVKTIRYDLALRDDMRKMFLDEARLMARLDHPAIAQVYDFGEENGTLYLAMEYVPGLALNRLLKRRPGAFPPGVAAQVISEVCRGLHAAHELVALDGTPLGVVHRDVSPQNVMLTFDGRVKILDFGIAQRRDREAPETGIGVMKGKISYAAPEQITGDRVDRRTDVYGASVVLYELVAGKRPFHPTVSEQADLSERKNVARPSTLLAGIPEHLETAIMRGVAYKPDDRFPDAKEFAAQLERIAREIGGESIVEFAERELSEDRKSHRERLHQIAKSTGEASEPGAPAASQPPAAATAQPQAQPQPQPQAHAQAQVQAQQQQPPPPAPTVEIALPTKDLSPPNPTVPTLEPVSSLPGGSDGVHRGWTAAPPPPLPEASAQPTPAPPRGASRSASTAPGLDVWSAPPPLSTASESLPSVISFSSYHAPPAESVEVSVPSPPKKRRTLRAVLALSAIGACFFVPRMLWDAGSGGAESGEAARIEKPANPALEVAVAEKPPITPVAAIAEAPKPNPPEPAQAGEPTQAAQAEEQGEEKATEDDVDEREGEAKENDVIDLDSISEDADADAPEPAPGQPLPPSGVSQEAGSGPGRKYGGEQDVRREPKKDEPLLTHGDSVLTREPPSPEVHEPRVEPTTHGEAVLRDDKKEKAHPPAASKSAPRPQEKEKEKEKEKDKAHQARGTAQTPPIPPVKQPAQASKTSAARTKKSSPSFFHTTSGKWTFGQSSQSGHKTQDKKHKPTVYGLLAVDATPNAVVVIDGRTVGFTPLNHLRLPTGRHDVQLRKPYTRTLRWRKTVTIYEGKKHRVSLR